MRRAGLAIAVLLLAIVPAALATQVTLDGGGPVTGGTANDDATFQGASADGQTVAFTTVEALSSDDGPNDTKADLYVRRGTAAPQLLTPGTSPIASAEFDQVHVLAGGDVFFTTYNRLGAGDADSGLDAYLAKPDGTIELITGNRQNPGSTTGITPSIYQWSADGTAVAFTTTEDLLASDTQSAVPDVYRFAGDQLSLVTVGIAQGYALKLSADGGRVYWFSSAAQPGVTDTDGGGNDLFYADGPAFPTVTSPTASNGHDGLIGGVDQSPDGATIVLDTNETFSPDDTNSGSYDIYAFTGGASPVLLTNGATGGTEPTLLRACPGGTALFVSDKRLLPADTDNADDIYRAGGGATTLMTPHPGPGTSDSGVQPVAISADCATVAWTTRSQETGADNDTLADLYAATDGSATQLISTLPAGATDAGDATAPLVPATLGGALLFRSTAQLAAADTDTFADVYQWDRGTGAITLVSTGGADQPYDQDLVAGSSDGGTAVVATLAKLTGDSDTTYDVYRYRVSPDPAPSPSPASTTTVTATPSPSPTPIAAAPTGKLTKTGKPTLQRKKKRIALGRSARCSVACTATVTIKLGKRRLVRKTVEIKANRTTVLRVELAKKALRTLRRKRRLAFAITLKAGAAKLAAASFKATVKPR